MAAPRNKRSKSEKKKNKTKKPDKKIWSLIKLELNYGIILCKYDLQRRDKKKSGAEQGSHEDAP